MTVSLADQIRCVEREINIRKFVYPMKVVQGKMSEIEKDLEIERMKAVYETLILAQRTHLHLRCNQQEGEIDDQKSTSEGSERYPEED
jgi:hypothetical protein